MNTTVRVKGPQVYKDWQVIDAAGRPLGRVASEAATLLKGKHKPTYEPHLDDGDFVIIVNASQVHMSGRKRDQITYYTHSGYPGGLRARSFVEQMERHPDRVIKRAVWGMLPKGPLGKAMLKHLKVYRGPKHPHQSQVVGSERERAGRAAGFPWVPPRLRPLSGDRAVIEEEPGMPEVESVPEAAPARPVRARKKPTPAEAAMPPDAPEGLAVAEAPALEVPAVAEASEVVEAPVVAEAPAAVEAQPAAEVAASSEGATSSEEAPVATAPRPRRRRTTKAAAEATPEAPADPEAEAGSEEK